MSTSMQRTTMPGTSNPLTTLPRATLPPVGEYTPPVPREISERRDRGDNLFFGSITLGSLVVLAIMAAVGLFLSLQAVQALSSAGLSFLTTSKWQPDTGEFGIAAVMTGTVAIAAVAVAVALPVSFGTALFVTEIAPVRIRPTCVALIDLMAAVPSVVYGLWGLFLLQDHAVGFSRWLSAWLSWIPIFRVSGADPNNPLATATTYSASAFIAGIVVAMMVMPIQCSIMRQVFSQVPSGEVEGAFALGATRWGMIRIVSIPFGRAGIIGGTMLGLGRALGETIAVVAIISPRYDINFHILEAGGISVSSLIALRYSEASEFGLSALMAAGLALFAVTLVVNFTASIFIGRSRSGASSEV